MRTHTPALDKLHRTLSKAMQPESATPSRRQFLRSAAAAVAASATSFAAAPPTVDVAIVGAGLAGLACADELRKQGIRATIYEASQRAGGRCYSLRDSPLFPGQTIERGGEFIDNLHKTMLAYAQEFNLTLEDVAKQPGEVFYYFDGVSASRIPEAKVIEEFRAFVPAMRADLRRLSAEPTALSYTPEDQKLDWVSLREYLDTRRAGPIVRAAIEQAYIAEYGRSADDQSCLNFLLFMHADRRSKFTTFGVFSDERYHIVEGNDEIPRRIAARLQPGQIVHNRLLTAAALTPTGKVKLTFQSGATATHDTVVLAIPFSTLRLADLSRLNLSVVKLNAIQKLGYGANSKMMVGFTRPYWRELGSNGSSYSTLPDHQATWETNPTLADNTRAVLTDYRSAERGSSNPGTQEAAKRFLTSLDQVYPGAASFVRRIGVRNEVAAHLEHWPSNPLSRGSYTCYLPGQFTTIAGHEGTGAAPVYFAGEHSDSFYEWQGFMEGALRSGIAAAKAVVGKRR